MTVRVLTMADLENFYLGYAGHPFLALGDFIEITKEAGDIYTGLGEAYLNRVFGALVWTQLNMEANAFGVLPKTNWPRSGWRVQTELATADAGSLGVGETEAIPEPVRPKIETVQTAPKIAAFSFEVSDVMESLAQISADDIWGSIDQVRALEGREFIKRINQQLLTNVDTPAGKALESIDRVCSGHPEAGLVSDPTDVDIYGIDRHTDASWADAVVLHNNGTARDLTDELIRELLQKVRERGGNTNVFLTGYDTYAKIQGLYMNFVRYMPISETKVQLGVNGVQTAEGLETGIQVAALYGIPLIQAVDTPKDTIARLYALDTTDPEGYGLPRLAISVLRPVEYFETRDFALLNKFAIKGVYRFVGELVCRFFGAQGKIRDLQ